MNATKTRRYISPLRKNKASHTRRNIADAAEKLLREVGYRQTTISAIASEAGVSPQTVYAVYGSKRGIIAEILERTLQTDPFHEMYERIMETLDPQNPQNALRRNVQLLLKLRRAEKPMYEFLLQAGISARDMIQVEQQLHSLRWERLQRHVSRLLDGVRLKEGITLDKACDIFYVLTNRNTYHALVTLRGWSPEAYGHWVYTELVRSLLPEAEDVQP